MPICFRRIGHLVSLVLLVVVGYWRLAFFQSALHWDARAQAYPWSVYISDCLRSLHLPLWNPYVCYGYPMVADPQSRAFYPPVWLISWLFGYSFAALQLEFVLHCALAAVFAYCCAKTFRLCDRAALFAGIVYPFTGIFVGNAEHVSWVISVTWLPLSLLLAKKTAEGRRPLLPVLCGASLGLVFLGGYPGFFFATGLLALALVISGSVREGRFDWRAAIWKSGLVGLSAFASAAVTILPALEASRYITRGPLTLDFAQKGSLPPQLLLAALVPNVGTRASHFFGIDVSMTVLYFGLVCLAFLLLALVDRRQDRDSLFLMVLTAVSLFLSFGKYSFLRGVGYAFVPCFDYFRFPSLFRGYFFVAATLLGALAFDRVVAERERSTALLLRLIRYLLFLLLALFLLALGVSGFVRLVGVTPAGDLDFCQPIVEQAPVQLLILGALFLAVRALRCSAGTGRAAALAILLVLAADMLHGLAVNFAETVGGPRQVLEQCRALEARSPRGFVHDGFALRSTVKGPTTAPGGSNDSMIAKEFQTGGYNPFLLGKSERLQSGPAAARLAEQGLFFFAGEYLVADDQAAEAALAASDFAPRRVLLRRPPGPGAPTAAVLGDPAGCAYSVQEFTPNRVRLAVAAPADTILVVQQAFYPGWRAYLDGRQVELLRADVALRAVAVPAGAHQLTLAYGPRWFYLGCAISAAFWLLVAGWAGASFFAGRRRAPGEGSRG